MSARPRRPDGSCDLSLVKRPQPLAGVDAWPLVDALLHTISHDLRSPLLSLTLSADLLSEHVGVPSGGTREVALDGLRYGARDMERMLQSLTVLSRARRRVPEHDRGPLGLILGGHLVMSEVEHLINHVVAVDPVAVRELLDEVVGDWPAEIRVRLDDGFVLVDAPVKVELPPFEGLPLYALASSLQTYAGGVVERLAALQMVLGQQGASFAFEGARLHLWLPSGAPQ